MRFFQMVLKFLYLPSFLNFTQMSDKYNILSSILDLADTKFNRTWIAFNVFIYPLGIFLLP